MTTTGASSTYCEVNASQMEDGTEVHINRRIHRLKDKSITKHSRIMLLIHDL